MSVKRASLRRRVYLWLTTSERDRLNRRDFLSQRAMAQSHRDRVQRVNDAFHRAGHANELHTYESLTLQFRDNAWGFLVLPAAFVIGLIVFVTRYRSGERNALKEEHRRLLENRAVATEEKRSAAQRHLKETRAELPSTLDTLRVTEEEKALAARLAENLRVLEAKTSFSARDVSKPTG